MLNYFRKVIPDRHPIRLLYHKIAAFLAAIYYWFPADNIIVIGVTGTNGKSTTVNLITNILNSAGYKVGMTSTVNFQIAAERWTNPIKQTTLSPFELQGLLSRMVDAGCKYAVIEVTSHALDQARVFGINFDIAVITNVTADHVEYHGSFNEYLNAKGLLFKKVSRGKAKFGVPKVLILNVDDAYYNYFNQFVVDRKVSYGLKNATLYAKDIEKTPEGSSFVLHVPNNSLPIHLKMPGEINVYNALAAASVCMALQLSLETIKKGLEESGPVAGRFEHLEFGQEYSVIVDYAHTPEALENLLNLYRKITSGRLFLVFGATGGGRDKSKRPRMGQIANEVADYFIVTDDDPYEEDEWGIIDQVSEGIAKKEGMGFWKIPDRKEAIRLALTLAKKGDCVLIAGKGSEEIMIVRGKTIEWSDRKVVQELLTRQIEVRIEGDEWEKRENVCLTS